MDGSDEPLLVWTWPLNHIKDVPNARRSSVGAKKSNQRSVWSQFILINMKQTTEMVHFIPIEYDWVD
jgi:hypothetical protein